ncbi:MAG: hypothetical protein [Circular genetic element sp.]|nr:MAG: hypothetical protein [Circular genetic element sp.]
MRGGWPAKFVFGALRSVCGCINGRNRSIRTSAVAPVKTLPLLPLCRGFRLRGELPGGVSRRQERLQGVKELIGGQSLNPQARPVVVIPQRTAPHFEAGPDRQRTRLATAGRVGVRRAGQELDQVRVVLQPLPALCLLRDLIDSIWFDDSFHVSVLGMIVSSHPRAGRTALPLVSYQKVPKLCIPPEHIRTAQATPDCRPTYSLQPRSTWPLHQPPSTC